jgi:hypothetical protein
MYGRVKGYHPSEVHGTTSAPAPVTKAWVPRNAAESKVIYPSSPKDATEGHYSNLSP